MYVTEELRVPTSEEKHIIKMHVVMLTQKNIYPHSNVLFNICFWAVDMNKNHTKYFLQRRSVQIQ